MTERLDPFAEIALREHPLAGEQLVGSLPNRGEPVYFAPAGPGEAVASAARPAYEQRLAAFDGELAQLRERYAPYLRDLVPAAADREADRSRLELSAFRFRYREAADNRFTRVLDGEGDWEETTVPDFRGPTMEDGRWTGFYRTTFAYGEVASGRRAVLVFLGVDYAATVYVNGRCVGSHEGMFAPFEFDITDMLQPLNTLVVEVRNDYPMMGVGGSRLDGDKLYAATGPGWDDPGEGWHHCPPGAGIYNSVYVEERPELHIRDIFVRPDIDQGRIELWVDVNNALDTLVEDGLEMDVEVYPRNFAGEPLQDIRFPIAYAGPGMNYFRYRVDLTHFRLWEPDTPCLYTVRVRLKRHGEYGAVRAVDRLDRDFGMRKFTMDESGEPKGSIYFNNRPIVLRGANEMGHLQQCVMRGDYDQLIDDILIAKLAGMNFYRITQRPVQREIYDYMDRLGMMHQCDLPLFSYLRRNQFSEAVRQAGEMERLVRGHASTILVSLINEPSRVHKRGKGHRHLFRDELEAFFVAARKAIYIENPDRVVKNVDGDYEPPTTEGMPDFHCYTMWYTNHAMPIGKLMQGELPPLLRGWRVGCGEYGTEGLDNYDVMAQRYPREWLPEREGDKWMPDRIYKAQTYKMHGDWYEEPDDIHGWIAASQRHQALATAWMTDALRRRVDVVVSTAVHLLIDAWPSGWMKALVGVDRVPKPAYFAFRDSLQPVRVNLRGDRLRGYAGETLDVEAWWLNDTAETYAGCVIRATVRDGEGREYGTYRMPAELAPAAAGYAGTIRFALPEAADRAELYVDARLYDAAGAELNAERFAVEVFVRGVCGGEAEEGRSMVPGNATGATEEARSVGGSRAGESEEACSASDSGTDATRDVCSTLPMPGNVADATGGKTRLLPGSRTVACLGQRAAHVCGQLGLDAAAYDAEADSFTGTLVVSDRAAYERHAEAIRRHVLGGARVVLLPEDGGGEFAYPVGSRELRPKPMGAVYTLAVDRAVPALSAFRPGDLAYCYHRGEDRIEMLADEYFDADADGGEIPLQPLVYTYGKEKDPAHPAGGKRKWPVVGLMRASTGAGADGGEYVFANLRLDGLAGCNPTLDRLLAAIIAADSESLSIAVADGEEAQ